MSIFVRMWIGPAMCVWKEKGRVRLSELVGVKSPQRYFVCGRERGWMCCVSAMAMQRARRRR